MRALAIFGLHGGLSLAVQLILLVLVALWIALVWWTYADANRRVDDPMLVACATAGSFFFPFVGAIVYAIVRPPEYLDDVRERELEIAAAQARLADFEHQQCQYCGFEIEKSFLRCPSCLRRLKEPCTVCGKPLDPRWKICPYCEAEVGQQLEGARRRPRRAASASGAVPPRQAPRPSSRTGGSAETSAPSHPGRASRDRPQSAG